MLDYVKENERQFKEAKKLIGFSLRGNNKYYYANQCAIFAKNFQYCGKDRFYVHANSITFNKYSINLGPTQYHSELKRFNNKEEMLGYVAGYNAAKGWF
tara:strand:- start:57 stop:353 length:297 start_codon:yes stop_codon:yes gene_type:complete